MRTINKVGLLIITVIYFSLVSILSPLTDAHSDQKGQPQTSIEIKKSNLKRTIDALEGYKERSSRKKQNQAILWANEQFKQMGFNSWMETYQSDGQTWYNGFARIEGQKKPSEIIMVITHIDSIADKPEKGAPGADDNASGVTVLLECARLMKNIPMERSVQFCIFTNEERGLKGSRAFAKKAKQTGLDIRAAINIDALGYNQIIAPVHWSYLWSHHSLKYKAKTAFLVLKNVLSGAIQGKDLLLVAGRPQNASLVKITAGLIRAPSGLGVKELTVKDCA